MSMSYESAITRIGERVSDRTRNDRQDQLQRRNQVVDIYGMEFTRQGDANTPATFYISVSPDLIYYERFEFKIIIQPFAMPVGGSGATGSATVSVNDTSLSTNGSSISPNPHRHTAQSHNHSLDEGVTLFTSSISNFEVWMEGINLTPYLKAQYGGQWITGEGVFPTSGLSNYDILKAVGYMNNSDRESILRPGYKKMQLKSGGAFSATLVNYLKFSHVNR